MRARDAKREAVLRTAVQVFLEQGYYRATLNEVAERLNITKPALYNYFGSKNEILFECWELGRARVDALVADINADGGTGLSKLRRLIRGYGEVMTTDYGACLVRFDQRDLTGEHGRIIRAAKSDVDRTFRRYLAEGVADGSLKPCNVKLAAFSIAGALNWIGHWYRHDGPLPPAEIAEEFATRLIDGIAM